MHFQRNGEDAHSEHLRKTRRILPLDGGAGDPIAALPEVLLGVNQTIMLALSMLGGTALLAVLAVAPGIGRDSACAVLAAMLALKPACWCWWPVATWCALCLRLTLAVKSSISAWPALPKRWPR